MSTQPKTVAERERDLAAAAHLLADAAAEFTERLAADEGPDDSTLAERTRRFRAAERALAKARRQVEKRAAAMRAARDSAPVSPVTNQPKG